MIALSASSINRTAPYPVMPETEFSFSFTTDMNYCYELGFTEDQMISENGVYQFFIKNVDDVNPVKDVKIKRTVIAVLEEFFTKNNDVILYICDTRDNKQALRNRLFNIWFATYPNNAEYHYKSYSVLVEDTEFFAAIIIRKDNIQFHEYTKSFDDFISDFIDKCV